MYPLTISLFGRFSAHDRGRPLAGWEAQKVQELVAYLLLHPGRPHHRELLANVLWGDTCTTSRSKTYLRKALWKLQAALPERFAPGPPFLHIEPEWVRLDLDAPLDLDIARFDEVARQAEDSAAVPLDARQVDLLERAVALYTADLLEGWTQDWCLLERERLRHLLLLMLDKLMDGCEAQGHIEAAIAHGHRALRYDRAREYTHRHLMRLCLLRHDRTGALRQFRRCERALAEELDVRPSHLTLALYESICADVPLGPASGLGARTVPEVRRNLLQLQGELAEMQRHLQQTLQALGEAPAHRPQHPA